MDTVMPHPSSLALLVASLLTGCNASEPNSTESKPTPSDQIHAAEQSLSQLSEEAARAQWIYANFITDDTATLASDVGRAFSEKAVEYASLASTLETAELTPIEQRKRDLLLRALTLPAPVDSDKSQRLAELSTELGGLYGKGRYCITPEQCLSQPQLSSLMATSRDPDLLKEIWTGWREIAKPMRPLFAEQVTLANEGAQALGYQDVGELWRSKYDMAPDAFPVELDRLWGQVEPLYEALHCYVRGELGENYGADVVPQDSPIPAHLLGNMWAQQWGHIYPLVAPDDLPGPGYDLTELLAEHDFDEIKMVRQAEQFFTSLGFEPLPDTFWQRSLFVEPEDRDVVCHASAWNLDNRDDIRIKMCIRRNGEDFKVIHHELGHNIYQRAYKDQPFLFKDSANDGFHEAIGDVISLSITPSYLKQIGLIDQVPPAESDIGLLLRQALDKVAFLPFGLMIDQWRWQVFSGEISADRYNQAWWDLRQKYQGVAAPVARTEADFDPGAKYHVPGSVPYTRYFLAHILQFQMFEALCEEAGYEGPIHRCSLYGSEAAGTKLNRMLEMGLSQPWPQALEVVTGNPEMSGQSLLNYFAPLHQWLDEQNRASGRQCGW
ncbi:M2 family metallopeptidase [Ferrimonas gelatinilytica]|uniref:M2 family metallopeptidase n=1 Tax=Ferrimonas gelatinilytica TaxID=1255257 RepID=A0ABP9RWS8_9GAMM